MMLKLLKPVVY